MPTPGEFSGTIIEDRSESSISHSPVELTAAITFVDGQNAEPDSPRVIENSYGRFESGSCHSPSENASLI